jgi:hypothetical protein
MIMNDIFNKNIDKLEKFISRDSNNKSKYWKHHHNHHNYKNIYESSGYGIFTQLNKKNRIFHLILSVFTFGIFTFFSKEYQYYSKLFKSNNRQVDNDTFRHIKTFILLRKFKNIKKLCIIGDGKANFLIGALKFFPNAQIFSVNLSETLINDYSIINKFKLAHDDDIQVIEKIEEINSDKKIFLIPSSNKEFLQNMNIDLFINICAFQEMTQDETEKYFNIIKNNKSYLYSCNREYKNWKGEVTIFKNYPWGDGIFIFYDDCKWHKKYYNKKFPFIHKQANCKHCLIRYNNLPLDKL